MLRLFSEFWQTILYEDTSVVEEFAAPVFVDVVSKLRSMVWLYRQAARVVASQMHEKCKKV
jgi:hypothetical protein